MSVSSVSRQGVSVAATVSEVFSAPGQGVYMVRVWSRILAGAGVYQIDVRTEKPSAVFGISLQERPVLAAGETTLCHSTLSFYLDANERVQIDFTGLAGDTDVDYQVQLIPLAVFMGVMDTSITPGVVSDESGGSAGDR